MDALKNKVLALLSGSQGLNKKLVVLLLTVTALAAYALNFFVSQSQEDSLEADATKSVEASQSVELVLPELYIHVVGEAKNPGIYLLKTGSRLVDAVLAAGGFTEQADQSSINLARVLTDGEQVIILAKVAGGQAAATFSGSASSANQLINLNRATADELEELPGVGPALAGRMVDWRLANGGFKSKDDLQNVSGIGDKLFASIEPLVTL